MHKTLTFVEFKRRNWYAALSKFFEKAHLHTHIQVLINVCIYMWVCAQVRVCACSYM